VTVTETLCESEADELAETVVVCVSVALPDCDGEIVSVTDSECVKEVLGD
jgi:hypothetical protein